VKTENENLIVKAIDGAAEIPDPVAGDMSQEKPRLFVEKCNPDRTVAALRDVLADRGSLYDRGMPVALVFDQTQKGMVARPMRPDSLVLRAHQVCRPYALKEKFGALVEENVQLPRQFAVRRVEVASAEWDCVSATLAQRRRDKLQPGLRSEFRHVV
jgi:hypothetical protein